MFNGYKEVSFVPTKRTKEDKTVRLSPKQVQMAEMLANPESEYASVSEMCRKIDISRNTYYSKWLRDEAFTSYVDELIARYTDAELASVWRALIKQCIAGNVTAIKLFFELKGKYRQQIDVSGGVVFIGGEDKLED